jgi:DNA polymerase-3 subunit epsilon
VVIVRDGEIVDSFYSLIQPEPNYYNYWCTQVQTARRAFPNAENHQLHTISMLCGYRLENHHHALADAEACAWIAKKIL